MTKSEEKSLEAISTYYVSIGAHTLLANMFLCLFLREHKSSPSIGTYVLLFYEGLELRYTRLSYPNHNIGSLYAGQNKTPTKHHLMRAKSNKLNTYGPLETPVATCFFYAVIISDQLELFNLDSSRQVLRASQKDTDIHTLIPLF